MTRPMIGRLTRTRPNRRGHRLAIALERLAVFDGGGWAVAVAASGGSSAMKSWMVRSGSRPTSCGVGADERAREDAAGQARQVAALERLERHHGNAGAVRDLPERNAPLLARFAEAGANGSGWGTLGHYQCVAVNVREPLRRCQTRRRRSADDRLEVGICAGRPSGGMNRPMPAMPAAPARATAAARSRVIPPIASTGSGSCARHAADSSSSVVSAVRRVLRGGLEQRAEDQVVDAARP